MCAGYKTARRGAMGYELLALVARVGECSDGCSLPGNSLSIRAANRVAQYDSELVFR